MRYALNHINERTIKICVCVCLAATHLPVVHLNFAAVSQETRFSRDVVEGCVRETLLLLFRALASEKSVFLALQGIGVLSFKNNKVAQLLILYFCGVNGSRCCDYDNSFFFFRTNLIWCYLKVRMKFNRDFIDAMDGTGRLLLAFNNVSS